MPSTVIRQFSYDAQSRRLVIAFQSGLRYAYFEVPAEVHEGLQAAVSRGTYFNERIRDRYSYALLSTASSSPPRPAGKDSRSR